MLEAQVAAAFRKFSWLTRELWAAAVAALGKGVEVGLGQGEILPVVAQRRHGSVLHHGHHCHDLRCQSRAYRFHRYRCLAFRFPSLAA